MGHCQRGRLRRIEAGGWPVRARFFRQRYGAGVAMRRAASIRMRFASGAATASFIRPSERHSFVDRGRRSGYGPHVAEVRRAVQGDAEGIAHVHVDSWRATYPGYMPASILDALSYEGSAERWRNNLTSPRADTYVAVDECNQVLGFASLGATRDSDLDSRWGELYALYVAPARVRAGCGRLLMKHVLGEACSRYSYLHLWVADQNANAIAFYEAQGFSLDGKQKDEVVSGSPPLHHLRMVRFDVAPPSAGLD